MPASSKATLNSWPRILIASLAFIATVATGLGCLPLKRAVGVGG